jgi:DNA-binding NarL/FixJ family response regulator
MRVVPKGDRLGRRAPILIADDPGPTRQSLTACLTLSPRIEVVGEAVNGYEAVHMVAKHQHGRGVIMYNYILVPLDGSERAEAILPHVKEWQSAMMPRESSCKWLRQPL